MCRKVLNLYLPNATIVARPVCATCQSVFGLNPGHAAEKLVIVWKYSQTVYCIHYLLDNGRAFSPRSVD